MGSLIQGFCNWLDEPTDEDARRFDRRRKDKKVSNEEWVSPTDPDAKITKMKDGTTHMAYKAEHVVDLDSDLILAAEIRPTTDADTQTLADSVLKAEENLQAIGAETSIEEVVADKGYHAAVALELCDSLDLRTYIPEPKRKSEWDWTDRTPEQRRAVHGNRQRVRRDKGKQLQKRRSELCERSFAHVCETGGMRRTWLCGLIDVTKRYLIATAAHNLGRVLRTLFGVGKPRMLQGSGDGGESGEGTAAGIFGDLTPLWHILKRQSMLARSWPHRLALSSATRRRAPALAG
jgi:transposase